MNRNSPRSESERARESLSVRKKAPSIAWLVYDSRSGSTTLARALASKLRGLWVTPEIGFDTLLRAPTPVTDRDLRRLVERSSQRGDWVNLGVPSDGVATAVRHARDECVAEGSGAPLIRALLRAAARAAGQQECSHILVKNGTHLRLLRRLRAAFGSDTPVIFLVRDPRAVAESKLRTRRPYRPWETFAWGGALHAAIRWRTYASMSRQAVMHGARVLVIRFEDFATDPDATCERVRAHLGLPCGAPPGAASSFRIPIAEEAIHTKALAGVIDASMNDAWKTTLPDRARIVIEFICGTAMKDYEYRLSACGRFSCATALVLESGRCAIGVVRHTALGTWHAIVRRWLEPHAVR